MVQGKESEHESIPLPKEDPEAIKTRVKRSNEFKTAEDYITLIVEEELSEQAKKITKRVFTREEEEEIKSKLRALGYL